MTNAQKRKVVTSGNKENRAKFACSGCDKAFESSAMTITIEKNEDDKFACPHCPKSPSFSGFQSFLRLAPAMLVAKKEKITTYLPMFINQEAAPLVSDLSFTGTIISHSSKSNNNESLIQNAGLNFGRVPPLFTGAIIADSTFTYIITSCEGDSFPHAFDPVSRRYEDMKILVDKQSDGGGIINKLIIGTAHFNLLITGGFLLHPVSANAAAAGPTTHPYLINRDLNHASLYYREEHLDRFQAMTMPS
ncbi:C2H2-type zinc finger transcription factor [Mucor lusitanicus]